MSNNNSFIGGILSFIKRKTSQKYRFNQQYANKQWDGLRSVDDLGRYSLIAGYIRFFSPDARILDLGCGEGVLQERIRPEEYSHYLGIDISDVAIANARNKANKKTEFLVGDLARLKLNGVFDAIVYNESIYYLSDPGASVRSLFSNISSNGIFIVSCYNRHGKEDAVLWSQLDELLSIKDRVIVTNRKGDSWTIHVYTKKDQPAATGEPNLA